MAELIPMSYRLRLATRQRLRLWVLIAAGVALTMTAGVSVVVAQERSSAADLARLQNEYLQRSTMITKTQELVSKRSALASRMEKIQQLMDDRILLGLIHNTAMSKSPSDMFDSIHIKARDLDKDGDAAAHYSITLAGITETPASLAELMTRLGKQDDPPVSVTLQNSRSEEFADGKIQRFAISCERPGTRSE